MLGRLWVEMARKMHLSAPARSRTWGGRCERGYLAGELLTGDPTLFDLNGTIKQEHEWMVEDLPSGNFLTATQYGIIPPPPRMLELQNSISVAPPVANEAWKRIRARPSTPYTRLLTNIWTPTKFPFWQEPSFWQWAWPWDPT